MGGITEETVMRTLYCYYLENSPGDAGEIARGFVELDRLLEEPTLRKYDRI